MPRLVGMVLRWTLVPILFLVAEAMAVELFRALHSRGLTTHSPALWFAGGFAFRLLFRWTLRRLGREDPLEFIDTLEHELTHALMGYATLCPPVSLSASLRGGGEVELKGSNPLAALAPYYLPLWCLIAALTGLVAKGDLQSVWNHAVLFLLGWFAYRLFREYRWRQPDLHIYGFAFSTLSVLILLALSVGLVLRIRGLLAWDWIPASARHMRHSIPAAWDWAHAKLDGSPE